jgi:hypothetical protein
MDQVHAYDAPVGAWRLVSWRTRPLTRRSPTPWGRGAGASGRVGEGVGVSAHA